MYSFIHLFTYSLTGDTRAASAGCGLHGWMKGNDLHPPGAPHEG